MMKKRMNSIFRKNLKSIIAEKVYLSVDEIALKLRKENKAFKVEKYVHSYPHSWRTDEPLLYYPLDSWFIKVTDVKDRMFDLNETINWKPKSTGEGRFGNWLKMPTTGIFPVQDIGEFRCQFGEQKIKKKRFSSVL
jgi:isoleucyl-tRNA synthetase